MFAKVHTWLLTILVAGTLVIGPGGLAAQDDMENPFATPIGGEEIEDPFASGTEEPSSTPESKPADPFADAVVDDPFAPPKEDTPSEENPFAAPGQSSEVENPFAPPKPVEDPFAAPAQNRTGDSPFQVAPGQTDSPFDKPFSDQPGDPFANDVTTLPPAIPSAAGQLSPEDIRNLRGLYVVATQPGMQTYEQLKQLVTDFEAAEFNALYAEVRTVGGVAYSSETEKSLPFIRPGFTNPVRDLKVLLPPRTRVIAVVSLLPSYNATITASPPSDHLLGKNPGLINRDIDGNIVGPQNYIYMDPGNPAVRAYLKELITEIERQVTPDGYLFTGLEYPGDRWGYSEGAIAAFRSAVGGSGPPPPDDPTWTSWRRYQIDQLLTELTDMIHAMGPAKFTGVVVETQGKPPRTWQEWTSSPTYSQHMQDWMGWFRDNRTDQLVFEAHERVSAQQNTVREWVSFTNSNSFGKIPSFSLAGGLNFVSAFATQVEAVRSRGNGFILYHYANPVRTTSRGYFASLPNVIFRSIPGKPVPGDSLVGEVEVRQFAMMNAPPRSIERATPTPEIFVNPLEDRELVFATPTPLPTMTPVPSFVPDNLLRRVTMTSGQRMEAVVLEVTAKSITLKPPNGAPIVIARSVIAQVEPPL